MKTIINIEIESSEPKKYMYMGDDLSEEQEKEFHNIVFDYIEQLMQDDGFEYKIFNHWIHQAEFLNPKAKEFQDLFKGLSIKISQENVLRN